MNCQEVRENLSAYLDGELDKQYTNNVAAHLMGCGNCRREWEQLKMINALWQELPEVEPPPEFLQGLNKKLAATTVDDTQKQTIWARTREMAKHPWYKFVAVAAVFGMALGISTLWGANNGDILKHPQVTKAPNYTEGVLHQADTKGTTPTSPGDKNQVADQAESPDAEQSMDTKKDDQQSAPSGKPNQPAGDNNTSDKSSPSAQSESIYKSNAANMAANVSMLSIKIDMPASDLSTGNQKVYDIAAKYNARISGKNNDLNLKFPLGTDISLLLDEFRSVGEVSTVPIKDVTKEYQSQIKSLEQNKATLQAKLEGNPLKNSENIQEELATVQNEINKKYDELKELSDYVNIIVKLAS